MAWNGLLKNNKDMAYALAQTDSQIAISLLSDPVSSTE